VSVGRHGSPGPVLLSETLHSLLIAPADLDKDQIKLSVLTHAEVNGMSVMREGSSNGQIETILEQRIKGSAARWFHGVASLDWAAVRALRSQDDDLPRFSGERWFSVLDTDMPGLPHHADIFATVPKGEPSGQSKARFRKERARLMDLMSGNVSTPTAFRGGEFAKYSRK
jgi:hypothetical protein